MYSWNYLNNGFFELCFENKKVLKAYATGESLDGRRVDTRTAILLSREEQSDLLILTFLGEDGLILTERLGRFRTVTGLCEDGNTEKAPGQLENVGCGKRDGRLENEEFQKAPDQMGTCDLPILPWVDCELSSADGAPVSTRLLIPLIFSAPDVREGESRPAIWSDLWMKMLTVPYDNTMWLRYEALPLKAGRKSYDVTVLFSEESREGLLVGALDFDRWKNAFVCSATDANTVEARCGAADEGTHDTQPHGTLDGLQVSSSRFGILYGEDYRDVLELYGDCLTDDCLTDDCLAGNCLTGDCLTSASSVGESSDGNSFSGKRKPLRWREGVPFGFNSWAGLAFRLTGERYEKTGAFVREELMPAGYQNQGTTYINLDAGWNVMSEEQLVMQVEKLHSAGQKAGIYDAPFAWFGRDTEEEIPGIPGHSISEILLKDERGRFLPRVDGAIPYDVTHPLWRQMTERKFANFVRWDFDYVKVDFMSHGGMEGVHHDSAVSTGRQAINQGYALITDLLDEERIGRPFFISLSIAPIFPYGYGHARRVSCDAFGTAKDVEYELNSHTWGWWLNGRLYQYNDPDHIVLYKSFGMEKPSLEGEARARYTSAVIGGTVMMLSDDYEVPEARQRALLFARNREVNEIAASQTAFRPVDSAQSGASEAYTAVIDGKYCIALFHFREARETVLLSATRAGLNENAVYRDLWSGRAFACRDGVLQWEAQGCDALLLKEEELTGI